MKQTVELYDFRSAFAGSSYADNFSREGLDALYDYLTDLEEGMDEELELDIVAFCVEYTEYENLGELKADYDNVKDLEDLKEKTTVIEIKGTDRFIIQDY